MESINGVFLRFLTIVFVEGASALNFYSWKYVWEIFDSKYLSGLFNDMVLACNGLMERDQKYGVFK